VSHGPLTIRIRIQSGNCQIVPMLTKDKLAALHQNLLALGAKRLTGLAAVLIVILCGISLSVYVASRPEFEVAYIGLSKQDINKISAALGELGVAFDVGPEGNRILVPRGQAARARAQLAEKGLPAGSSSGYEIYDKLGPLGLTSFMQDVTRTRVLEGEISQTIEMLQGVRSARVHIVLPDAGSFRRQKQGASGSVVIRAEPGRTAVILKSVRHLVAAAVPGLVPSDVMVMNEDGTALSKGDGVSDQSTKSFELEKEIAGDLRENIIRAIQPSLGIANFEVSVSVRLNLDKKTSNETVYDPDSKTARSTRVMREQGNSLSPTRRNSVSVEQNIPGESNAQAAADVAKKDSLKREEVTNYEIGSRSNTTTSDGYRIESISAAIVIDKKKLHEQLGSASSKDDEDRRLADLERIAIAATGLDKSRGHQISVTALEFTNSSSPEPAPPAQTTVYDLINRNSGAIIKSLAMIVVAAMFLFFGMKPAVKLLAADNSTTSSGGSAVGQSEPSHQLSIAPDKQHSGSAIETANAHDDLRNFQMRIEQLVNSNPGRAAEVIRSWVREEA